MKLTGHQPNYLPYPGFFQKIAASEAYLVVDTTQFVKRGPFGWIHRNRISSPNGPIWLSLPVLSKGKFEQKISQAELNPNEAWGKKHWKSIEFNYRMSPHFEKYAPSLKSIYQEKWTHLSPFTTRIIEWFLEQLEIEVPVHIASQLRAEGKASDYIVSFCQELGATEYLSGIHGRDYLDLPLFTEAGIDLFFQEYEPPQYLGRDKKEVTENLSMLDMLFWAGGEAVQWVHQEPHLAKV